MADGYIPFAERVSGDKGDVGGLGAVPHFLAPGGGSGGDTPGSGGGNSGGSGDDFDPDIHIGRDKLNADGSYRRKRGRKSNSTDSGNRSKANNQAGIESLTRVLAVLHVGIASATHCPEMVLQDDESTALAAATANVLREFDIRPDPKIEAIIGLMLTAGSIYGPRVYLIRTRLKEEKRQDD